MKKAICCIYLHIFRGEYSLTMPRVMFAMLVVSFLAGASHAAWAQGYEGLIPDNRPAEKGKKQEAPGYEGLIPGYVAPKKEEPPPAETPAPTVKNNPPAQPASAPVPAQNTAQPKAAPAMTPVPSGAAWAEKPQLTMEDLNKLARDFGMTEQAGKIPAPVEKMLRTSFKPGLFSNIAPRPRTNGMLPAEERARERAEKALAVLHDKSLPPTERRMKINAAYSDLSKALRLIDMREQAPDVVYQWLGVPDTYVQEEKEGNRKARDWISAAMAEFKRAQP